MFVTREYRLGCGDHNPNPSTCTNRGVDSIVHPKLMSQISAIFEKSKNGVAVQEVY